jgi:DNA-binding MarR family transcriptional regulator
MPRGGVSPGAGSSRAYPWFLSPGAQPAVSRSCGEGPFGPWPASMLRASCGDGRDQRQHSDAGCSARITVAARGGPVTGDRFGDAGGEDMAYEEARASIRELDAGRAAVGLTVLLEVCERAVEEVGAAVPPAQLRALLVIDREGSLNLNRLAGLLGASASAASRLCDRMHAAGLVTRDRAASNRREILLLPTGSGRRLADWVRGRRRAALADLLRGMSPDGAEALARGLEEIAADPAVTGLAGDMAVVGDPA